MPILRLCSYPRCRNARPCPQHQRKKDTKTAAERKFYGSGAWKRLRAQHLSSEPLCRECASEGKLTPGRVVDHIRPIRQGGDPFNPAGLQTMCDMHHAKKRQKESRGE